jgi:hypothetical protein
MFACSEQKEAMKQFTLETVLAGVHYFRCLDHVQLIACVRTLEAFLKTHPKVS